MGVTRFLLALSVVYMHYGRIPGTSLLYGSAVVLGFFIISGFYMSLVLTDTYKESSQIRAFYINRALRIFPAYITVLALTYVAIALSVPTLFMSSAEYWRELSAMAIAQKLWAQIPTFAILGQDLQFYFGFSGENVAPTATMTQYARYPYQYNLVPQAWSIAIELYFYLLAPLFARLSSYKIALIAAASLLLRVAFDQYGLPYDPWLYRCFPSTIGFFLLGMLSHRAYVRWRKTWETPAVSLTSTFTLVGLILTQNAWSPLFSEWSPFFFPDGHLFLWASPFLLPGAFAASKNWKWDRLIGDFSYPIYLVHILVYTLTFYAFEQAEKPTYFSATSHIVIYVSATVCAAGFMLFIIDRPIDRWRHQITQSQKERARIFDSQATHRRQVV